MLGSWISIPAIVVKTRLLPEVNLDTRGNAERGWMQHDVFLPHEIVGSIWRFDQDLFHSIFGQPHATYLNWR